MAKLLVNADDFGLHESINVAIENCVDRGSVNSVSIVTNGSAPDFAMLHRFESARVFRGVHLTWVGEPWLTMPVLIHDWSALAIRLLTGGHKFRDMLYREAAAQVAAILAGGIPPDHIDSHQHVHHLPVLWQITRSLQEEYKIPRIRVAATRSALIRANPQGWILNTIAKARREQTSLNAAGVRYAGHYTLPALQQELRISQGLDTELILHPGADNKVLADKYKDWGFDWEGEYKALMSESFLRDAAALDFELDRKR